MLNILFSTTRQWNVGDEFILFGVINLMRQVFPEGFNPIIYNRHPDLRTDMLPIYDLRGIKLYMADELTLLADAEFRVGFRDNSFKLTTDGYFLDLVVFAGTPEWSNSRCFDLYKIIEKYNLPVIALGIGNRIQDECELILRNLYRFKLFTVRSPELVDALSGSIANPIYLPCPSICSSAPEKIRSIEKVNRIGLIYSCDVVRSEINNCVSTETYDYLKNFYLELIHKYHTINFSLICHYIDELPFANSDFPGAEILYSFDARDYYDIYNRFDLVIGARVHGIGCAASMGIPGVCVLHDFRGETVKGFFADTITINQPLKSALEMVERAISSVTTNNKRLVEHIDRTKQSYISLIRENIHFADKTFENYSPPLIKPISNIFDGRPQLAEAMRELRGIENPKVAELEQAIAERDSALAERDRAIAECKSATNERDQAIAERDNAFTERDKAIAECKSAINKRDQAIAERDNAFTERDRAIAECKSAINERDQAIAERDNAFTEQGRAIAECKSAINERDQAIVERDRAIAERDSLFNSTTWKMTAPIRAIVNIIKKVLRGNRK